MAWLSSVKWLCFGLLISCAVGIHYKAAVVEYSPDQDTTDIAARIQNNLNGYEEVLKSIKDEQVQIIVFPEDGLCGFKGLSLDALNVYFEDVPGTDGGVNPCIQSGYENRPILRTLSCLARKYQTVLVANMGDSKECNRSLDKNCPAWGKYLYNADVVFENDGRLIAKYHKIHLFSAEKEIFSPGTRTSGISFRTNFGVTFGIFTCYDILFDNPADCLLDSVKNFIFPTAWGNEFPFYMSTVVQQGWSYRNRANLLAANLHIEYGDFYGTGSGLYSAGFARKYFISGERMKSKVLVTVLPDDPANLNDNSQEGTVIMPNAITAKILSDATFQVLDTSKQTASVSVASDLGSLTCAMTYELTLSSKSEIYALGAYYGKETSGRDYKYLVCFVTKCNSAATCGLVTTESDAVFQKLELTGTFPPSSKVYPSAFSSQYKLVNPESLRFGNNSLVLADATNIVSMGLWAMVGQTASVCHN